MRRSAARPWKYCHSEYLDNVDTALGIMMITPMQQLCNSTFRWSDLKIYFWPQILVCSFDDMAHMRYDRCSGKIAVSIGCPP